MSGNPGLISSLLHHGPTSLGHSALLLGGGLALAGGVAGVNAMLNRQAVNQSYTRMLQRFPELTREDPTRVRELFTSVSNAAPDVAKDPIVTGSLVKRMLNYDGIDHATYMELVKTQESMTKTRSNQFTPYFQTADVSSRLITPLFPK